MGRRARLSLLALLCACSEGELPAAGTALRFTEVAAASGVTLRNWCGSDPQRKDLILESMGAGAAWLDDDGDGLLDLFIVNGSSLGPLPDPPPTSALFRNVGGGRFVDATAEAGVGDAAWGHGVAAADYDNDGDTDLFVTNWGPHILYRNDGTGRFTDVAAEAGVDGARAGAAPPWGAGAAWGDIDADGWLDLYVTHYLAFDPDAPPRGGRTHVWRGIRDAFYGPQGCIPQSDRLYRNRGDGSFEDVTAASGVGDVPPSYGLGAIFGDFDLDGDADLYVGNDSMANWLFLNDGTGRFTEQGLVSGVAYAEHGNAQASMGLDAADVDGDGDDDLLVTNFVQDVNTLYENERVGHEHGPLLFRDVTAARRLGAPGRNLMCWGCGLSDLDNDGDLDAFIAAGHLYPMAAVDDPGSGYAQPDQLLELRDGVFVDVGRDAGLAAVPPRPSRGAALGDHDGDGDVDVAVVNLDALPSLYRNDSRAAGTWLQVKLVGSASNRDGVGARVTVAAAGRRSSAERRAGGSYLSTHSPWLHFGLGAARRAETLSVRWPSGRTTEHGPVELPARLVLREE